MSDTVKPWKVAGGYYVFMSDAEFTKYSVLAAERDRLRALVASMLAQHLGGEGEKCPLALTPGEACYSCTCCGVEIPPSGIASFKCAFVAAAEAHAGIFPNKEAANERAENDF